MTRRLTDADLAEILRRQGKEVDFAYRANPKPRVGPSESQIQQALLTWWAIRCPSLGIPERLLFAVPLQAARSAQNGNRMKREGARKGTPDLFLLVPRGDWHGMALEMKRPGGRVSPEQTEFMGDLATYGYFTAICYSMEEAQHRILFYLGQ